MATNPQSSPSFQPEFEEHPSPPTPQNEQGLLWLWVGVIIASLVLVTLLVKLPTQTQPRPTREIRAGATPSLEQVQLSDVNMTIAPAGSAMYLDVILQNNGGTNITGLQVRAEFKNAKDEIVQTQLRFVAGAVNNANYVQNLVDARIPPHQSSRVRIYFDTLPSSTTPQGWNRQPPKLSVVSVTGAAP